MRLQIGDLLLCRDLYNTFPDLLGVVIRIREDDYSVDIHWYDDGSWTNEPYDVACRMHEKILVLRAEMR